MLLKNGYRSLPISSPKKTLLPEERYCRKEVSDLWMRMMAERTTSCVKCSITFSFDRISDLSDSIFCKEQFKLTKIDNFNLAQIDNFNLAIHFSDPSVQQQHIKS